MRLEFSGSHSYEGASSIAIPVKLRVGSAPLILTASIDTGAEFCIFESAYAAMLGLRLESGIRQRFRTVVGSFECFGHEVEIEALGVRTTSVVYFYGQEAMEKNVLGRQGWLDKVRLGLVHYDRQLFLADYNHA